MQNEKKGMQNEKKGMTKREKGNAKREKGNAKRVVKTSSLFVTRFLLLYLHYETKK